MKSSLWEENNTEADYLHRLFCLWHKFRKKIFFSSFISVKYFLLMYGKRLMILNKILEIVIITRDIETHSFAPDNIHDLQYLLYVYAASSMVQSLYRAHPRNDSVRRWPEVAKAVNGRSSRGTGKVDQLQSSREECSTQWRSNHIRLLLPGAFALWLVVARSKEIFLAIVFPVWFIRGRVYWFLSKYLACQNHNTLRKHSFDFYC